MFYKKETMTILSILVITILFGTLANTEQKNKLPRSYGPLYLGMSVKEFKKIFVGVDLARCVHCAEEELEADLCITKESRSTNLCDNVNPIKFKDAYVTFQPNELKTNKITCFFYKGVLYDIVMGNIAAKVGSVKEHYIKDLGKPTADAVWDTGLSQLRWEHASTMLSVTFATEKTSKKNDDDFIEIRYTDLKILKQLPQGK
ncbi:MAG: hypothetical protein LLF28_02620 [Nitrospiraceae bacterium]|nr:hypothetical protein [Nitrospiraceae bacterium]